MGPRKYNRVNRTTFTFIITLNETLIFPCFFYDTTELVLAITMLKEFQDTEISLHKRYKGYSSFYQFTLSLFLFYTIKLS